MSASRWQTERRSKASLAYGDDYSATEDQTLPSLGKKQPSIVETGEDSDSEDERPGAYAITRTTLDNVPEWDPTEQIGNYQANEVPTERSLTELSESVFEDERLSSFAGSIQAHSSFAGSNRVASFSPEGGEVHRVETTAPQPWEHPFAAFLDHIDPGHQPNEKHDVSKKKKICSGQRWTMTFIAVGCIIAGTIFALMLSKTKTATAEDVDGEAGPLPEECHFDGPQSNQTDPFQQCACFHQIETLDNVTRDNYHSLRDFDVFRGHLNDDMGIDSCDPANIALVCVAAEISALDEQGIALSYGRIVSRYLLAFLYATWHGGQWKNKENWLTHESECNWHGVECNSDGKITSLSLYDNNLRGSFVSAIGLFQELKALDLRHNAITGSIPSELWRLPALEELRLGHNRLQGTLPSNSLSHTGGLKVLSLDQNAISGPFPDNIFSLKNLVHLNLSSTEFHGIIPEEGWEVLSQLEVLDISCIRTAAGFFPSSITSLTNLRNLNLHETTLSGTIPTEIGRMTSLAHLSLQYTGLRDTIPTTLGNCKLLERLSLFQNHLTGTLPTELGSLSRLEELTVHASQLHGAAPVEYEKLENLKLFSIFHTEINGIPGGLCDGDSTVIYVDSIQSQSCSCCTEPTAEQQMLVERRYGIEEEHTDGEAEENSN